MTITYRSMAVGAVMFLLGAGLVAYLVSPAFVSRAAQRLLSGVAGGLLQGGEAEAATTEREAHFVNLHGEVRIKKANSTQWTRAEFRTALERGDLVQTGQEGMARIIFTDGTTYVLKPETLIAIEESRQDPVTRANKFTLIKQSGGAEVFLEISQIVQHGKVLEVVGRTEPGSSVIINNEQVFSLAPDGTFRHFMSPVADAGAHQVSVTAQTRRGDVNTVRRTVVIE